MQVSMYFGSLSSPTHNQNEEYNNHHWQAISVYVCYVMLGLYIAYTQIKSMHFFSMN
jgi:protein-S-isoprenylcysteine O-methyltransferase Ste14